MVNIRKGKGILVKLLLVFSSVILCFSNTFAGALVTKTVKFNPDRSLSFKWGWDLFEAGSMTGKTGNINLAKAAIYLCEGTYRKDAEERIGNLNFKDSFTKEIKTDAIIKDVSSLPMTMGAAVSQIHGVNYLIIAAAVRGSNDLGNWLYNIKAGFYNVDLFEEAGDAGFEILKQYCKDEQSKKRIDKDHTILLLTGHSLGGAVAGQMARESEKELASRKNIYAYTFAAPHYKTFDDEKSYTNIHNFINNQDAVPKFPGGYKRNGIDHAFKGNGRGIIDQHADMEVYLDGMMNFYGEKVSRRQKLSISNASITIYKGETFVLSASTRVKEKGKRFDWTSKNTKVATVAGGRVHGVGEGRTTVYVSYGKHKEKCIVVVKERETSKRGKTNTKTKAKKSITLNKRSVSLEKGKTIKLSATVKGMSGKIKWSSSDKNVATVDSGIIKGVKKGTATIIAECGGLKAKCSVSVNEKKNSSKSVWYSYSLYRGGHPYNDGRIPTFNHIYIEGQKLIIEGDLWIGTNLKRSKHLNNKTRSFKISNQTKIYRKVLNSNLKYKKERISLSTLLEKEGFSRKDHVGYDTDFHVKGEAVVEIDVYWS